MLRGLLRPSAVLSMGAIENTITEKLTKAFSPQVLEVRNESFMHNVPKGAETHFKVVVVSEAFQDVKLLERHRRVNDALQNELSTGVHALSIVAKTPSQWESSSVVDSSPSCSGGDGRAKAMAQKS
ncbi:hypothetical protein DIPPA_10801 [Diplonema papillatum]|nr:hypothetical protein DIPPA_10801 [Diplonema papillatum]